MIGSAGQIERLACLELRGGVLTADTEALVNTVNCVGVMGRGIALQFRKPYPEDSKFMRRPVSAKRCGLEICSSLRRVF
jgi:hypothetical protein